PQESHLTLDEANHWPIRIGRPGIEIEHVLHPGNVFSVDLWNAPHVLAPRLQIVFGQAPAHGLLWRVVSWASSPAKSSKVQRERPAGGLEQAVATSKASSLPVSLRRAPGRGSSVSAAARLPSTKRALGRYTVEPPTPMLLVISSSLAPRSAASRICARLSLRAPRLPPLSSAVSWSRSHWSSSTR